MDRRVKRTINSIEKNFIKLLKNYAIEEITIQQIADEADINRATFYKYYQDKYDLLNNLEDKEISRIKENIDYEKLSNHPINSVNDLNILLNNAPKKVIKIILNNIELYEVLFSMKRQSTIEDKLSETVAQNFITVLHKEKNINGIPFRYFHSFVSGAIISTIKFWVLDTNKTSEEDLVHNLNTLMHTGPFQQLVSEVSNNKR